MTPEQIARLRATASGRDLLAKMERELQSQAPAVPDRPVTFVVLNWHADRLEIGEAVRVSNRFEEIGGTVVEQRNAEEAVVSVEGVHLLCHRPRAAWRSNL